MTNRFMISVAAAALIAGSGFAFAQGAGGAGGAGGGVLPGVVVLPRLSKFRRRRAAP